VVQLVPADMTLEFPNRIPKSEIRNSFQSTEHNFLTNCHKLTDNHFLFRISEFDSENSSVMSAGTSCTRPLAIIIIIIIYRSKILGREGMTNV